MEDGRDAGCGGEVDPESEPADGALGRTRREGGFSGLRPVRRAGAVQRCGARGGTVWRGRKVVLSGIADEEVVDDDSDGRTDERGK